MIGYNEIGTPYGVTSHMVSLQLSCTPLYIYIIIPGGGKIVLMHMVHVQTEWASWRSSICLTAWLYTLFLCICLLDFTATKVVKYFR